MLNYNGNYLKLIIGPMFSSKSSSLLAEINRYKYLTDKILVINSVLDLSRHPDIEITESGIGLMKTHDHKTFPAIMLNNLNELKTNEFFNRKYNNADIVLIDEGQFYSDLYDFVRYEIINTNRKTFIVAGLNADYNMEPLGDIIKLVPMADDIVKLSALCLYCKDGTPASFTRPNNMKEFNESSSKVGGSKMYSSCCRFHLLS